MTYLLILLALLGCMALTDARWKLFLFKKPAAAVVVLLVGTGFFLAWDIAAIAAGIFLHRDSALMTGIMIAEQLPLEEGFFLLFLCYQTMILFTVAERWLERRRGRKIVPSEEIGAQQP